MLSYITYILCIKNDCCRDHTTIRILKQKNNMNPVKKWQEQVLDQIVQQQKDAKAKAWNDMVSSMQQQQQLLQKQKNLKTLQNAVNAEAFVPVSHKEQQSTVPVSAPREPYPLQLAVNAKPFVPFSLQSF